MLDYAQRDQRWCQGNMQHMGLLLADGFHPASRLHLSMGVMSYLSSPLWLMFLTLSLIAAYRGGGLAANGWYAAGLFALTMTMLLLPKAYGLMALHLRPGVGETPEMRKRAWLGVLLETFVSILIAPIMMLLHSQFVLSTLRGTKVKWNAQQRDDRGVSLGDAILMHWAHTLVGVAVTGVLATAAPALLIWLSPVLLGLVLSIPLSMVLGSLAIGQKLRGAGLLTIPEEVESPQVLKAQHKALAKAERDSQNGDTRDPFALVLEDPAYLVLHLGILRSSGRDTAISRDQFMRIMNTVRKNGVRALPPDIRFKVQSNRYAMEQLHVLLRAQKSNKSALCLR